MQSYQGKIEQTVVDPLIINAFVIPNNICLTRGWYCEIFLLKIKGKKKKSSENIFVFELQVFLSYCPK